MPKFATYFTFSEFNRGVRATLDEFRAALSTFNGPAVVYARCNEFPNEGLAGALTP